MYISDYLASAACLQTRAHMHNTKHRIQKLIAKNTNITQY